MKIYPICPIYLICRVHRVYRIFALLSLLSLSGLMSGCSSTDPFEPYNRAMYKTNKVVDKYTLKPLAQGYRYITPDPVENGVSNFFDNIGEVGTTVNSLLQGKLHNAAVSSSRVVWNTTLGIGGIFDVATAMDIKSEPEDFGQTLQTWGIPAGPYLVLPVLGPSTVTDGVGRVGDYYLSPITHYDDWAGHEVREGVIILGMVNARSRVLDLEQTFDNVGTDEYSFVRSAYLQRRANLVRDGKVEDDSDIDEAFDALFDDESDSGE